MVATEWLELREEEKGQQYPLFAAVVNVISFPRVEWTRLASAEEDDETMRPLPIILFVVPPPRSGDDDLDEFTLRLALHRLR